MCTIPTEILKRALYFVSTEETRYYLNGVHVHSTGRHVTVAATDGDMAYVWGQELEEEGEAFSAIIPTDALKAALKALKNLTAIPIHMHGEFVMVGGMPWQPIDGTFPDIARVIPRQTSGEAIEALNPSLLVKIGKALGQDCPCVYLNGNGPCIVQTDNEQEMILIMPRRGIDRISVAQDWSERLGNVFGRSKAQQAA